MSTDKNCAVTASLCCLNTVFVAPMGPFSVCRNWTVPQISTVMSFLCLSPYSFPALCLSSFLFAALFGGDGFSVLSDHMFMIRLTCSPPDSACYNVNVSLY